ncbi:MAG: site-specific integrase [bacterium]|nr:site-specific integrase [bacterium]
MSPAPSSPYLAPLVQSFFLQRLVRQRNASPATIAAYRDTFRLWLRFIEQKLGRSPTSLTLDDLDAPLVLAFLDHLERERGNTIRTRNARLAALRSFAHHVARQEPTALPNLQRVLAIPSKRHPKPMLGFLSRDEVDALLKAPDESTWSGRRDRALLLTLYNTGARVSEVLGLDVEDLLMDRTPRVTLHGKGRKERTVPLWPNTARSLAAWVRDRKAETGEPLFPNGRAGRLSRSGVATRLALAVQTASEACPSLRGRRVSPHTLRHTTAMHLLQSGTDLAVIAIWMGHESPATTHAYLEADLAMKERALARVDAPKVGAARYRPSDKLLAFLDGL